VNIIYMLRVKEFKYLILVRDDLSEWIKKQLLREREIKDVI
jgi:hypothetical protein